MTESFPEAIRHGDYVATFVGVDRRWEGDPLATASWEITLAGKLVGRMFEHSAYGWGRPHCSMRELVWSGPFPLDASDPRSPNYGLVFDTGPEDGHAAALASFAQRADRLLAWRRQHKA